jgi:Co/Zn/Cd efflux system component
MSADSAARRQLKSVVATVALLNLGYFGVEAAVAIAIKSVALFADSVDFLEDATINLLVLLAIGWSATQRRRVGLLLAFLLLIPGLAALWTAAQKLISAPVVPEPTALTVTGLGALCVNALAAYLLARVRHHGGSLTRAAFLSARNDVLANLGIIAAGLATFATGSIWPDILIGVAIMAINLDAARDVYKAAMSETDDDDDITQDAVRP